MSRLLLPAPGTAGAFVAGDQQNPSAEELVVADVHLHRLKERVGKSLKPLTVMVWKRTPHQFPNAEAEQDYWTLCGMWSGLKARQSQAYTYSKTLQSASEVVKLKWELSAADIIDVFRYWNNKSVLECDERCAAICIEEIKPLKLGPDQQKNDMEAAIANRLTLVVWRLKHIIEEHLATEESRIRFSPFEKEDGPCFYCPVEGGPFDADGNSIAQPLVLTASDILPLTHRQSVALAHKPQLMQAIHLGMLDKWLCEYGEHILKSCRRRRLQNQLTRANKRKKKRAPRSHEPARADKPYVDPLEVTMSCTGSSDEEDADMDSEDSEDMEARGHSESDCLMRHGTFQL